jgi:hypothetical protein
VISHLDALAFAVFGQSVLAVKIVALVFGAAILAASWNLCRRIGGRGAARAMALLFVFAPESVQKNSLLALGIHFHALLFVALVLDETVRIAVERDLRPRRWLWLGIWAGFGLFFSYQLVLTIAVAAGALLVVLKRELHAKPALFGVLGFAIGVSPLLYMVSKVGSEVFDIHGAEVLGGNSPPKIETLQKFFDSVFAGRGAFDLCALIVLCASPLLGVFALRRSAPRTLRVTAWIVFAHIAVFLAAYVGTGFTVGRVYHYFLLHRLTPLWWLAAVFTALGAAAVWSSGVRWRRASAAVIVAALAVFGASDLARMTQDAPYGWRDARWILARVKGYSYPQYFQKTATGSTPHFAGSRVERLRTLLRFREEDPQLLHEALTVALYVDGNPTIEDMERELDAVGITDKRGFYLGLGMTLRNELGGAMASRVAAMESQPEARRDALLEAIGRFGNRFIASEDLVRGEVQQAIDAKLPDAVFRGLGCRLYDARGDASVAHYFEMRRGPIALDRQRAEQVLAGLGSSNAGLVEGYNSALLLHWLDGYEHSD